MSGKDFWENYHENGILPNIWKGATGQLSSELNADKTNALNHQINLENLDYVRQMTQAQWERDDSAHQREVQDLLNAGLSPLASLAGSSNSAVVTSGPQSMNAVTAQTMPTGFDLNGVLDLAFQKQKHSDEMELAYDKLGKEDEWKTKEFENVSEQLRQNQQSIDATIENLNFSNKKISAEIDAINNSIQVSLDTLSESIAHNKAQEDLDYENNRYIRIYERLKNEVPQGMMYQPCFSSKDYANALISFQNEYKQSLIDVFGSDSAEKMPVMNPNNDPNLTSWSANGQGGVNVFGTGGNIHAGANYNRDISKAQQEQWNKKLSHMRFPVLFSDSDYDLFDSKTGYLKTSSGKKDYRK